VLATVPGGLLSIAVEGKVNESFGPTVAEWEPAATPGRSERWSALWRLLVVDEKCDATARYQLFHRTASALIEARRFRASAAGVVVHSFTPDHASFGDFQQFARLLGGAVRAPGELIALGQREGISLYLGWVTGPRSSGGESNG
jgi:hypothetical protein